jgi:hypothetical protein
MPIKLMDAQVPHRSALALKEKGLRRWTSGCPPSATFSNRPFIGALLLGATTPLVASSFMTAGSAPGCVLISLPSSRGALPLRVDRMPLDVESPRSARFGSPLVLSHVHWVRPELVSEVKYLTWTEEGCCR